MKSGARLLAVFILVMLLAYPWQGKAGNEDSARMQWFADAKLGIFIHWGIYSVKGIDESWSFFNGYTSHENYLEQLKGFTADRYNPDGWAALIKGSGARYAVLTTKHHDGVALWDTRTNALNVAQHTPAATDMVGPLVNALRKEGVRVGLYYSLPDWSHPDYPLKARDQFRYQKDSVRFNKFLAVQRDQLDELMKRYEPDLIWFDGDWEHSAAEWKSPEIKMHLLNINPNLIVNSRLQGYGDYATPEQGVPITRPEAPYWELCLTMNDSWGYQKTDHNYKSANQIINIFADCIGMGGNLLLDIGPKPDGTIPDEQVALLKELGRWTKKHERAIFGTTAGIAPGYFNGPTTLSKDHRTLYLFISGRPNGPVALKGLKSNIAHVRLVGDGNSLNYNINGKAWWSEVPGILYIDLPEELCDSQISIIAVTLREPVDMFIER
ncbi:MAG: alpha-L-fucosidase [Bacteroidetes bacterium HGW-Bacteroidetes-22]|nr:MAG: alpha-L-fucosidase [Bacteroidetes bacterium HGW-Bacteroidetes-22]